MYLTFRFTFQNQITIKFFPGLVVFVLWGCPKFELLPLLPLLQLAPTAPCPVYTEREKPRSSASPRDTSSTLRHSDDSFHGSSEMSFLHNKLISFKYSSSDRFEIPSHSIQSFNNLLRANYVWSCVLGTGDTAVKKIPTLLRLTFYWRDNKQNWVRNGWVDGQMRRRMMSGWMDRRISVCVFHWSSQHFSP